MDCFGVQSVDTVGICTTSYLFWQGEERVFVDALLSMEELGLAFVFTLEFDELEVVGRAVTPLGGNRWFLPRLVRECIIGFPTDGCCV
jgi:hypothetical protein